MRVAIIDSGKGGGHFEKLLKQKDSNIETIRYTPPNFKSYSNISIQILCASVNEHLNYISSSLQDEESIDYIVVACMTLSTNCLEFIKCSVNNNPKLKGARVLDMMTCLPYIENDTTIFATPNTINSNRFSYCVEVPCLNLSTDIENNRDISLIKDSLRSYINRLGIIEAPKILLGCSHYSIIKQQFQEVFNPTQIIDPLEILLNKITYD